MRQREPIRGFGQVFEGGGEFQSLPDGGKNWALPFAIPYRAFGYFIAAELLVFVVRHLPVFKLALAWTTAPIAYTVIPALIAYGLTKIEPYGRPASRHLWALLRHHIVPKHQCGGRPLRPVGVMAVLDAETALAGDPGMSELPHGVIPGPATVQFRDPMQLTLKHRGRKACVQLAGDAPNARVGRRVVLEAGEELVVKS